jgi:hypothetical protein
MDMAGAARSVAWAQCWDNDEVLGRVKLQVHAAVGLELRKIPSELRCALQLKAKLLPAALKHLDHIHDIPAKKARQEGEGRGGGEVLCVTFSLSLPQSLYLQYNLAMGCGLRANLNCLNYLKLIVYFLIE